MSRRPIILHFTTLSPPTCPTILREARKLQTIRETTFAMSGNAKPFGKRLSPCAETPNHSGSDFHHARKLQTFRETTFATRGNIKPFGKWLSPSERTPNLLRRDLRKAHKGHKQKKRPFDCSNERSDKKEAATYSPALHCSTIGASGLNFSVRNGKRWDPTAITTWCIFFSWQESYSWRVVSWLVDKLFVF